MVRWIGWARAAHADPVCRPESTAAIAGSGCARAPCAAAASAPAHAAALASPRHGRPAPPHIPPNTCPTTPHESSLPPAQSTLEHTVVLQSPPARSDALGSLLADGCEPGTP